MTHYQLKQLARRLAESKSTDVRDLARGCLKLLADFEDLTAVAEKSAQDAKKFKRQLR